MDDDKLNQNNAENGNAENKENADAPEAADVKDIAQEQDNAQEAEQKIKDALEAFRVHSYSPYRKHR